MLKTISKFLVYASIISSIILGCKKEKSDNGAPTESFIIDSGYLYSDTAIACGDTAIIGLHYIWNGIDKVKTVNVYLNGDLVHIPSHMADSTGSGTDVIINFKITKSLNPIELWEFEVIDNKGNSSRLSLSVYIDRSGGNVIEIKAIVGAQGNQSIGSYYNIANNLNFYGTPVDSIQKFVDLIGGYTFDEKSFITSPGSGNLFGVYDLSAWTVKNLTLFCPTSLSKSQYDLINKDNLLKSSFHPEKAIDHIKNFKTNNIYSFKTQGNKYGLILLLSAATSESGFITFDAKIQE